MVYGNWVDPIPTRDLVDPFVVRPGKKISLHRDFDPGFKLKRISKLEAKALLQTGIERLAKYQDMLYAEHSHSVLIILQAMDAAGKDGVIKHVMSGLNPQGCQVYSFKAPSDEDLNHDYLWRCAKNLPERGRIGIFNRSYYEEVLVVRVHPEFLARQRLPPDLKGKDIWRRRFEEMNHFERYLTDNGIQVIKLYLNLSKAEQRRRFLARIERPEKNWKFSTADAAERGHWDEYMHAYEEMFEKTSTAWAPWYVVPADTKWFCRLVVSNIVYDRMKAIHPRYPDVSEAQKEELSKARILLERNGNR